MLFCWPEDQRVQRCNHGWNPKITLDTENGAKTQKLTDTMLAISLIKVYCIQLLNSYVYIPYWNAIFYLFH
jgi:hypothetical protein